MSATVVASYPLAAITLTTAASSRSRWERATISRGRPWRPRGRRPRRRSSWLSAKAQRAVGGGVLDREPCLGSRLVVAGEGGQRQVDHLRLQFGQLRRPATCDLADDQQLHAAEGEVGADLAEAGPLVLPKRFQRRDDQRPVAGGDRRVDGDTARYRALVIPALEAL